MSSRSHKHHKSKFKYKFQKWKSKFKKRIKKLDLRNIAIAVLAVLVMVQLIITVTGDKNTAYDTDMGELIQTSMDNQEELKELSENIQTMRYKGKTCVCLGDSVTGNSEPHDYPSAIAKQTGMTVINGGFGGTRMSHHDIATFDAFSMYRLSDAIVSGDWSLQENSLYDPDLSEYSSEHLEALKNVDWSTVDFVTIAYGTNDIEGRVAIDNEKDALDTDTYCGALRYSLERIMTKYPQIKILILTPIYRYWPDEYLDSGEKKFDEKSFTEWGDALMETAGEYKVPCLDMYRTLGINSANRDYFFADDDGTHPNNLGLKRIGDKVASALLSLY